MSELPYDVMLRPEKVAARNTLVHLRSRPVSRGIFEVPLNASMSLLAALMLDVSAEPGARVAGTFPVMSFYFLVLRCLDSESKSDVTHCWGKFRGDRRTLSGEEALTLMNSFGHKRIPCESWSVFCFTLDAVDRWP